MAEVMGDYTAPPHPPGGAGVSTRVPAGPVMNGSALIKQTIGGGAWSSKSIARQNDPSRKGIPSHHPCPVGEPYMLIFPPGHALGGLGRPSAYAEAGGATLNATIAAQIAKTDCLCLMASSPASPERSRATARATSCRARHMERSAYSAPRAPRTDT